MLLATMAIVVAGCSHPRDASRRLLDEVRSALQAAAPTAARHAPTELEDCRRRLRNLEGYFVSKQYEPIQSQGQVLLHDVRMLVATALEREVRAAGDEWNMLATTVPRAQQRVATWLQTSRKRSGASPNTSLQHLADELEAARALWIAAERERQSHAEQHTAGLMEGRESAARTLSLIEQTHFSQRMTP